MKRLVKGILIVALLLLMGGVCYAAYPSLTYTFADGQVPHDYHFNTNYNDLLTGMTDGTKDHNIYRLYISGSLAIDQNRKWNTHFLPVTNASTTDGSSLGSTDYKWYDLILKHNASMEGTLFVGSTATIKGIASITGNTNITGNTSTDGTLFVGGVATIKGNANITGNASTDGTLYVKSTATMKGNASVEGTCFIGSTATIKGNTSAEGTLFVGGTATVKGNASAEGTLFVGGATTVKGATSITGDTTITGNAYITSRATIDGYVKATTTLEAYRAKITTLEVTTVNGKTPIYLSSNNSWTGINTFEAKAFLSGNTYTASVANNINQGLTLGNGTVEVRYMQLGNVVFMSEKIYLGSTSSWSGAEFQVTPPIAPREVVEGLGSIADAGTAQYTAQVVNNGGQFSVWCINTGGAYASFTIPSTNVPFTWADGDSIWFSVVYEKL